MIQDIKDFEGKFPQMSKIDKWLMFDTDYGWNAVHALEGSVVNDCCMVVSIDRTWDKHSQANDGYECYDDPILVTRRNCTGSVIVGDTKDECLDTFARLNENRKNGQLEVQKEFMKKIRDIDAFYGENYRSLQKGDYNKFVEKELPNIHNICRVLGFESEDDHYSEDDVYRIVDIMKDRRFFYKDNDNDDIDTVVFLDKIESVQLNIEVDGRDCIQLQMSGERVFNIYKDSDMDIYKALDRIFR